MEAVVTLENKCINKLDDVRQDILSLLQWNEEQYGMYIFNTGISYLSQYFGDDKEAATILSLRKEFWNWFKMHWSYREQAILEHVSPEECSQDQIMTIYADTHNANVLAAELHPNRVVLGDSFSIVKLHHPC